MQFTKVPALSNWMVVQVVCGRSHTVVLTAQSHVFSWGDNTSGQLGTGDTRDRMTPTLVDALWALPVVQVRGRAPRGRGCLSLRLAGAWAPPGGGGVSLAAAC
eukprot:290673-Chlamydomonas_euryale.AAC.1